MKAISAALSRSKLSMCLHIYIYDEYYVFCCRRTTRKVPMGVNNGSVDERAQVVGC